MPPANTGNKAALVTWTVVATVFGITMAVLALVAYAGRNDAELRADKLRQSFASVASEADLSTSRFTDLKSAAGTGGGGNIVNTLLIREEELANRTAGTTDFTAANQAAQAKLEALASSGIEGVASVANLTGAVDALTNRIDALKQENQTLTQGLNGAQAALQQSQQQSQQQMATLQDQVRQALQARQEAVANNQTVDQEKDQLVTHVDQTSADLSQDFQARYQQAQQQIQQLTAQKNALQQDFDTLQGRFRVRINTDQMITSADGSVIRSPTNGTLYIDLGRQDSITTGMTFQVYDRVRGIPRMESATDLPKGKGSVQVVRVLPTQAECRVVEQTPGQTIREGDLIANLAYDKNVPPRFRIYGDFDLDNNGRPGPGDRERLDSLVRQFGGQVVDDVTVNTDVLVLGRQPAVPTLSPEERNDATRVAEQFRLQQQLDAYNAVLNKAESLNIPVLNQNQFLYYIGYFEQVRR